VTKNRAGYFWKTSEFVIQLRDLHEDGERALVDRSRRRHPSVFSPSVSGADEPGSPPLSHGS
jgi:hypothetical protein